MAKLLKPGERALAVPVDEQAGVGNRVLPGDYVDVFLSLKPPPVASFGKRVVEETQTRLLLSHLRVLAYGDQNLPRPQVVANDAAADDDRKGASRAARQATLSRREGPPVVPRTAVLAVPLEDADRLLLGVQNGRLALALRPAGDDSEADRQLFQQPGGVLAVRPGLGAEQRQALGQPENRAYAGISGPGLAGLTVSGARSRPYRHGRPTGLEIIRGYASESARDTRQDLP
jgi:pilus assembly protein CpaB